MIELKEYLRVKNAPNYSTLQKFYKRMQIDMFERITKQLLYDSNIRSKNSCFRW